MSVTQQEADPCIAAADAAYAAGVAAAENKRTYNIDNPFTRG